MRCFGIPLAPRIWFALLFLSYLVLSYNTFGYWWNAACGTALILFFARRIWGGRTPAVTGLEVRRSTVMKSGILTVIVIAMSWQLMGMIAVQQGIGIHIPSWKSAIHIAFYVMNEEIVLGAIPLYLMIRNKNISPIGAAIYLALFFAIIHHVFYRWVFDERGIIEIPTLLSLLMVGILRNTVILVSGHIAYSWAFHFGWILMMLGCDHRGGMEGESLAEYFRFNLYLGSWQMLTISLVLAVGGLILLLKKGEPKEGGS